MQRENRGDARGPKGQSGNPRGKRQGARHRTTLAAEALLDGEAKALTRKAIELALAGETVALRLCLDRILPPRRERPVRFKLPRLQSLVDVTTAVAAIAAAVAHVQHMCKVAAQHMCTDARHLPPTIVRAAPYWRRLKGAPRAKVESAPGGGTGG